MKRKLANTIPTASTLTTLYTVPTLCDGAKCTLRVLNPSANIAAVRVAFAATDTPTNSEYIDKDVSIPINGGSYEINDINLGPGEKVVIWSDQATTAFRLEGELLVDNSHI